MRAVLCLGMLCVLLPGSACSSGSGNLTEDPTTPDVETQELSGPETTNPKPPDSPHITYIYLSAGAAGECWRYETADCRIYRLRSNLTTGQVDEVVTVVDTPPAIHPTVNPSETRIAYDTSISNAMGLMTTARRARTELLPLHEERVRLARVVYEVGQSDVTVLRLAELDLLKAQLKVVRLEHRTAQAIIALDRATGGSAVEKLND